MPYRAFLWSSICIIGWTAGMRSCGPDSLVPGLSRQPHPTVCPGSAVAKRQCDTTIGWRAPKHNASGVTNLLAPYLRLHRRSWGAVARSAPHQPGKGVERHLPNEAESAPGLPAMEVLPSCPQPLSHIFAHAHLQGTWPLADSLRHTLSL